MPWRRAPDLNSIPSVRTVVLMLGSARAHSRGLGLRTGQRGYGLFDLGNVPTQPAGGRPLRGARPGRGAHRAGRLAPRLRPRLLRLGAGASRAPPTANEPAAAARAAPAPAASQAQPAPERRSGRWSLSASTRR